MTLREWWTDFSAQALTHDPTLQAITLIPTCKPDMPPSDTPKVLTELAPDTTPSMVTWLAIAHSLLHAFEGFASVLAVQHTHLTEKSNALARDITAQQAELARLIKQCEDASAASARATDSVDDGTGST